MILLHVWYSRVSVGLVENVSLLCCIGVVRPQQLSAVTSGITFHPLSASLAAAAATRPGFYFTAQQAAGVPGMAASAGIIPATSSLAAGVANAGAREPAGIIHC